MRELPGGTVTFVFTDIEASTELLKALGDRYGDLLAEHRRLVRETFGVHEGVEIDTQGDAFFFAFPRARDAVAAAVEAQRAHAGSAWPGECEVSVRMGLHTGEPAVHEEGYVGLDVVRAARICTLGRGGQILLSETTRALIGSGLPEGVTVFPLGQRHLRGIEEPERVFEVAIDGLERGEEVAIDGIEEGGAETEVETAATRSAPEPARGDELEDDISRRFAGLGARLAAGIQARMLRSFEGKLSHRAGALEDESGVDEIASRMASLGDDIEARIDAAFARRHPGSARRDRGSPHTDQGSRRRDQDSPEP